MHRGLLIALIASALLAPIAGAQPGPRESFSETIDVEIINIEVFATDKEGEPVSDLTRGDFEIFEDGKPVDLTHFAVHQLAAPKAAAAPPEAEAPTGDRAAQAEPPPEPLALVIFVDNQNLRPNTRKSLLDELRVFLSEHLRSEDLVMIVSADPRLRVRQGFTRDRDVLAQTLQELEKDRAAGFDEDRELSNLLSEMKYAYTDGNAVAAARDRLAGDTRVLNERNLLRARASMKVLQDFVAAVAELPGRKAVMHLSDGISSSGSALAGLRQVISQANTNRVTFFSLNGGGSKQFSARNNAAIHGKVETQGWDPSAATVREDRRFEVIAQLAEDTGGEVFLRGNQLKQELTTWRDTMDAYYSIAFSPLKKGKKGDRTLKIKVKRRGVELRYPQSYRLKTVDERLQEKLLAALLMKVTDNPMGVAIALGEKETVADQRYEVSMLVKIPLDKVVLLPGRQSHQGKVRVLYAVADSIGRPSEVFTGDLPLNIPKNRLAAAKGQIAGFNARLLMNPQTSRLAVAVYDEVGLVTSTTAVEFRLAGGGP